MTPEDYEEEASASLDGYRREEIDLTHEEMRVLEALEKNKGVLEMINAGIDMKRFKRSPAGTAIWDNNERKLAEAVNTWLANADPGSDEARAAHFNARVAISVMKEFQLAIDSGREAQEELTTAHEMEQDAQPQDDMLNDDQSMREPDDG